MSSRTWWDRWGKKVAGVACFAGAAALAPAAPAAGAVLGMACGAFLGNDDHVRAAGGVLGGGVRAVIDAVRGGKKPPPPIR